MTATYLDKILDDHRSKAAADTRSLDRLLEKAAGVEPPRGFARALRQAADRGRTPGGGGNGADNVETMAVISEIKRRSPSKGDLNPDLDPVRWATGYAAGGASCLSVLTDDRYFGGSADDLMAARAAVDLPVLRKDFTVSANDVVDARLMGADAVLLIVAALDDVELADFHDLGRELVMDVLVETHDEAEVERALAVGATVIGVNQRDLVTFEVDRDRAARLARLIPDKVVAVAESGIGGPDDLPPLAQAGYRAVLVGEALVTGHDPESGVRWLLGARG